ncbi:MAG: FecR domain-containing protein [Marinifilaceae bacterium]|jgi:hypothetical protein|nr:FecR domain-containing protein [Marinifilaceae bacterium]
MNEEQNIEQLLLDYCTGQITDADTKILRIWIHKNAENLKSAVSFVNSYRKTRILQYLEYRNETQFNLTLQNSVKRKRKIHLIRWTAAAAVLLLIVSSVFLLFKNHNIPQNEPLYSEVIKKAWTKSAILTLQTGEDLILDKNLSYDLKEGNKLISKKSISTGLEYSASQKTKYSNHSLYVPKGGEYSLKLSDGTKVWLNSDSELKYPTQFDDSIREIYLKGEAYFEVEKDKQRPFIVNSSDLKIKVLGTSFNISSYLTDKSQDITLVEGSVMVVLNEKSEILKPGQQAKVNRSDNKISLKDVDVYYYTSWRDGIYNFSDIRLDELIVKLSRWYDVEFQFVNQNQRSKRLNGAVKREKELSFILEMISLTTDVEFVETKNNIIEIK